MRTRGSRLLKPGNTELCEAYNEDLSRARALARRMPEHETFQLASRLLKAASDPIRAKILYALSEAELCVCEVAELLGTSLSLASHHLRILREADLIRPRKQGKLVFYILQRQAMNGMVHRLVTSFARDERRKRR